MTRRRPLALPAVATALAAAAAAPLPAGADTIQDFDAAGTPYLLGQHANPPAADVLPSAGPDGNFLRLAFDTATPPNINSADFERTDPGPACAIAAEFDFRITPGSGRADGLGFALLDAGVYGPAGAVPPPPPFFVPEEPNFVRSLGFGFDVYQNVEPGDPDDNHVSIHFAGAPVTMIDAGAVDLAGGGWVHAEIAVDAAAGTVSVTLTPEGGSPVLIATDLPVSGLRPYESRVHFGARSGGLAADHDLDNVVVAFTPCPPALVGAWSAVASWPLVAVHTHLLPTGEVMFWDRHDVTDGDPRANAGEAEHAHGGAGGETLGIVVPRIWDPVTGDLRLSAEPPFDLFCSGHTLLADGRLFVAGGHVADGVGLADAAIYDPFTDSWTDLPDMSAGRWYPTATTLADGDVLVVSGLVVPGQVNPLPEVWDADRRAWRPLASALNWQPAYPFMHLLPDGRVLAAGPQTATAALDTAGAGSWSPVADSSGGFRDYGSSVTLADGRVLIVGGADAPTATAELLDPAAPAPAWTFTGPMSFARRQLTATLLPDGAVLATGGTAAPGFNDPAGEVLSAEVYDPASGEWSLLAAAAVRRIYHSTALLLPDARVLAAGGGHPPGPGDDASHYDFEIFSPPYLFRGPRPVLAAAPARVYYGEPFTVSTPDPDSIADVTWLRPASVTHALNMNQRINRLAFTPVAGGLEIMPPADPAISPPGHYLLFLLDGQGVPSEARFVQILPRTAFADGFESGDVSAWSQAVGN